MSQVAVGSAGWKRPAAGAYVRARLCGMPRALRERMKLMALSRVYMDESGGTDVNAPSPTFIIAGLLADHLSWERFSDSWQIELAKYDVDSYHAFECNRTTEDPEEEKSNRFSHLGYSEKTDMQLALVGLIARHVDMPFVVRMSVADHEILVRPRIEEKSKKAKKSLGWDYPQGFMTSKVIIGLLEHVYEHYPECVLEYVLDHQERIRDLVDRQKRWMRVFFRMRVPQLGPRFGDIVMPEKDLRYMHVPLQAADLIAWHENLALNHPDGTGREVWNAIHDGLVMRRFDMHRAWLERFMAEIASPDPLTEKMIEAIRLQEETVSGKPKKKGTPPSPDGLRPMRYTRIRLENIEHAMTNPEYAEVSAIIDRIQEARARNNVLWMDIVRLVMRVAPVEARAIFDEIERNDQAILGFSAGLRGQFAPAESERGSSGPGR